jgi:hypothetical protein
MNNENSPFGSRSESPLDRAIDRAVRQMMEVDPPADLRRRVLARLGAPAPGRWALFPRYAAAAAAAAALVLAVVFVPRPSKAPTVVEEAPAVVAAPATPVAAEPPAAKPAVALPDAGAAQKATAPGGARPSTPHREPIAMPQITNLFGSGGRRVSAANAAESAKGANVNAPDPQPIDIPALAAAPRSAGQQKPEELAAAEARAAAAPPAGEVRRANVSLEITITEIGGPGGPVQKTVTMLVADRQSGSIRSRGVVTPVGGARAQGGEQPGAATLNVDASPTVYSDNSILVSLALEYLPGPQAQRGEAAARGRSQVHERVGVLVASGQPIVISQASDPASNRRITVELKATVLR